jgi:arylsulfatase A-like enzyme
MTRRTFFATASTALARLATSRPNLLFLLTDDHRWDALGAMGNRIIQTPHLDHLAAQGVTFEQHCVTTSICMTSRATIFSGLDARCHGIHDFATSFSPQQLAATYPALLRHAGYFTGFIGKYGVGNRLPENAFHFWRGFAGQGRYFPDGEPGPHLTARMGDQALEFLAAAPPRQPWCLSISFKAPHVQDEDPRQFLHSPLTASLYRNAVFPPPVTAHPRFIAALPPEVQRSEGRRRWAVRFSTEALYQESLRRYYRLITEVDTVVGRLRLELRRRALDQNTVILFTSDNGFYLGEHGLAGKWLMHEPSIRVPMILYDPRLPAPLRHSRRRELTLTTDLAPTLLEAAALTPPPSLTGRSLYRLLHGEPWRAEFFYEHRFTAGGWIPQTEGIRQPRWKYTRYPDTASQFEELFDLAADPHEQRNLASLPAHRPRLLHFRHRVQLWKRHLDAWRPDQPFSPPPTSPSVSGLESPAA